MTDDEKRIADLIETLHVKFKTGKSYDIEQEVRRCCGRMLADRDAEIKSLREKIVERDLLVASIARSNVELLSEVNRLYEMERDDM